MKNTFLGLFLTAFLFLSCDNFIDPPKREIAFYGIVVDQNNNPIEEVEVHYIYSLGQDVVFRNSYLEYSVPTEQNISIQIFNMFLEEIENPFNNERQQAGLYRINMDCKNYTNGIYHYKVSGESFSKEGSFPVLTNDINAITNTQTWIKSNFEGSFILDYSILNIGKSFTSSDYLPNLKVSSDIKFVLHKDGYEDLVYPINIDTTEARDQTFKMISK